MKIKILLIVSAAVLLFGCSEKISENQWQADFSSVSEKDVSEESAIITEKETEPEIIPETEIFTQTETAAQPLIICEKMQQLLEKNQISEEMLEETSQLVTVDSVGCECEISCFEMNENVWSEKLSATGFVGKNGVSDKSGEGDYCTPKGIYNLGFSFGTEEIDGLNIEYRKLNENCYWVDDVNSALYNQWVESEDIQWNSAENLIAYPQAYRLAVVIDYNTSPVIPGSGSAIFLHCSTGSWTAGCVSAEDWAMDEIVRWLDAEKNPKILIG